MAEEGAKLGVPEVSFNSFPGMGAVSLLSRRVGAAKAEAIIASGHVYAAREMFVLGVVDFLAPPGHGLVRLAGICVCSGTQSDSKPRCSTSRPRSLGRIA